MSRRSEVLHIERVKQCMCCGATNSDDVRIDRDHYMPKFLYKIPPSPADDNPPFKSVVVKKENIFPLCRRDHESLDGEKLRVFNGNKPADLDPVGLMQFLRQYPITDDIRFRTTQLTNMVTTHQRFIEEVFNLGDIFGKSLTTRFEDAAREAAASMHYFNRLLQRTLQIEEWSLDGSVDNSRLSLLEYPDHTSSGLGLPEIRPLERLR